MRASHFLTSGWRVITASRAIAQRAGMKGTQYHDLRHFFASQLIANGETAAYVRDQMGHSSIKVTFDTYRHLPPALVSKPADAMSNR
jgi:integrase